MFVVFDTRKPLSEKRYFKTKAGAKRATTCANRNAGKLIYNFVEASCFYEKYEAGTKTVRSLMTGKEVIIPKDTPRCCDPSTETFWSM